MCVCVCVCGLGGVSQDPGVHYVVFVPMRSALEQIPLKQRTISQQSVPWVNPLCPRCIKTMCPSFARALFTTNSTSHSQMAFRSGPIVCVSNVHVILTVLLPFSLSLTSSTHLFILSYCFFSVECILSEHMKNIPLHYLCVCVCVLVCLPWAKSASWPPS